MSNEERRAAKTQVLSKVNQVLATAGLNDTVWSVRDCDSTLFVLMYKKIVGVGKLQGVATQPTSTEEHARNFSIVLNELSALDDVPTLGVSGIEAHALAEGDLQALNDLAGVFAVMCDALLQNSSSDAARPSGSSSSAAAMPNRSSVRPASAIPASKLSSTDGAADVIADVAPAPSVACGSHGSLDTPAAAATASTVCASACTDAIASAVTNDVAALSSSQPSSSRPASSKPGVRGGLTPSGRKACGMKMQTKGPSASMYLHAISQAAAQRGPVGGSAEGAGSARRSRNVPGGAKGGSSTHLEEEIAELQKRITSRAPEQEASAKLGKALSDEFGARASSMYAALIKQSLASVRRAEAIEVSRGVARELNARRDSRIATIRSQRIGAEVKRAESARSARRAAKEELSYRSLYQHAVHLEREKIMLQEATAEEARRKTLIATRARALALENFHMEQLNMLHNQLEAERQERNFREKVQTAMAAKLEQEARARNAAALQALKHQVGMNANNHEHPVCSLRLLLLAH